MMMAWLSGAKLWLVGAALGVALFAIVMWRAFSAGKNSAAADAAITGLNKAIEANNAKRRAETNPVNSDRDPFNRDNWLR